MFTLEELKTLLGAGDDLTVQNAMERLGEALSNRDTKIAELGKDKVELQAKLDARLALNAKSKLSRVSAKPKTVTADKTFGDTMVKAVTRN